MVVGRVVHVESSVSEQQECINWYYQFDLMLEEKYPNLSREDAIDRHMEIINQEEEVIA